jgi:hypothetical protein
MVLLAFANVTPDRDLRDLSREEAAIRAKLEPRVAAGKLELVTLWNATVNGIVDELRKERFDGRCRVFHFGGHADVDTLMLANEPGRPVVGYAAGIVGYLASREGLVLVFLNGCYTRAHVERLRDAGVGAVVATTRAIRDDVAADFATHFYAELAAKAPLKLAFDRAATLVGGERPELVWELVDPSLWEEDEEEWDDQWPWVLSCDPELEGWKLVDEGVVVRPVMKKVIVDDKALVDALADTVPEMRMASVVLVQIHFPRALIPAPGLALVFWTEVVHQLRAGVIFNGVQTLIDHVAATFPGNQFFEQHRTRAP